MAREYGMIDKQRPHIAQGVKAYNEHQSTRKWRGAGGTMLENAPYGNGYM